MSKKFLPLVALILFVLPLCVLTLFPAMAAEGPAWVVAWTGAAQGPYPSGNATAQPDLSFAFPSAERGAVNQSFRLIVRPDVWGRQARFRLSNVYGSAPVTFVDMHLGLQTSGAAVLGDSNRAVSVGGRASVTVPPGKSVWTDPVVLTFVKDPSDPLLIGRKLAISFQVKGESGPMTWHAKGLQTSYIGLSGASHAGEEDEAGFPFSTTSWFFADAVSMLTAPGTKAVVAFGDSITDGTASTINGDDRWPDVFARRMHAMCGNRFSVVNQGIGGNQVVGPAEYTVAHPVSGGPSALSRLDSDIVGLPGVSAVVWLEGINDLAAGTTAEAVMQGYRDGVAYLRHNMPGVKIYIATLTPALGSTPTHGTPEVDARRKALNTWFSTEKLFDGVVDFDAVTRDPATGMLRAVFKPGSSAGGPGDGLHPNRAGYAAMGGAVPLAWFGK
jgi:lysophospholipase L1-like esterase